MAIVILEPLTMTKRKYRYLLVIVYQFSELTQVVTLRIVDATVVAVDFVKYWVLKYGVHDNVLIDNGKQFNFKFFNGV